MSTPDAVGPSDGTGPGLVINANLIMGNAAESGSGGGLRLQNVNGTDVLNFPDYSDAAGTRVTVTNNIIANNVAGWDGAGISLQDALNGEHHQQHDRVQRHHGLVGSALQHPGRSAGQLAGTRPAPRTAARHRRRSPPAW